WCTSAAKAGGPPAASTAIRMSSPTREPAGVKERIDLLPVHAFQVRVPKEMIDALPFPHVVSEKIHRARARRWITSPSLELSAPSAVATAWATPAVSLARKRPTTGRVARTGSS